MIGIIYKIIHNSSNIIYIGSTLNKDIKYRWRDHKRNYKNELYQNISIYEYFDKFGIENFKIILIKKYDVCDRKHLTMYEQLAINNHKNCINKRASFQPIKDKRQIEKPKYKKLSNLYNNELVIKIKKEQEQIHKKIYYLENKDNIKERVKKYSEENKDKIQKYKKIYREENKEKLREKEKERYECNICNIELAKHGKARHNKSKNHIRLSLVRTN